MAKRFTKSSVNWVELEKRVPPHQRVDYFAFKAKSDAYLRRVQSYPEEPPKINWDDYKKMVPIEGLVDKLKSEYESFKVPYPQDTLSVKVDEQWKTLEPEIKAFCDNMNKEIEKANKELDRIKSLPNLEEMTMETFADMFPDQAYNINRPRCYPYNEDEDQVDYIPPKAKDAKAKKK